MINFVIILCYCLYTLITLLLLVYDMKMDKNTRIKDSYNIKGIAFEMIEKNISGATLNKKQLDNLEIELMILKLKYQNSLKKYKNEQFE